MGRGEIVGTAIAMLFISSLYRVLMEVVVEENVGEAKSRDINSLLPWKTWAIGRYMRPYIKRYHFVLEFSC